MQGRCFQRRLQKGAGNPQGEELQEWPPAEQPQRRWYLQRLMQVSLLFWQRVRWVQGGLCPRGVELLWRVGTWTVWRRLLVGRLLPVGVLR